MSSLAQNPSPNPASVSAHSPPTKANLKAWWNHFNFVQKTKKEAFEGPYRPHDTADHPVFGKPLKESLRYASVQISTADANGELYVWGSIPVVVAKCGLYLKENATEVQGTFRVNGSNKRMRDLQAAFETPPRYGKSLDWKNETYTTHDVASVFRRYLTQMPEPVIPYHMYHFFRDALAKQPYNQEDVIATYKLLIRRMPRANQYLLLYVLDLLSVFARKSDKNLMTATNLAVIFRPGIMAHPEHEMSPKEHALSQKVLEFLIAQQDWFMLDIIPPPPPGGLPGDDDDENPAQGGAAGGGAGGWNGAGPSSRGGPTGGGSTGKWREGTSTPTRQGTMDSAWMASAEAGPSTSRPTTTRQRVISGGPDAGAWYMHGRSSGSASGYGHTLQNPPTPPQPQRNNSNLYHQTRSQSPPPLPTPQQQQARHTPQAPEQQNNSNFSAKNASPRSNFTHPNSSANIPENQRLYINQWDDGGSVFATPMSSLPPSPEVSASGHASGSSRHGHYQVEQEQQHRPYSHPQQQHGDQQQPHQQKPTSTRKANLTTNPAPQQSSSQIGPNTRDLGPTPIHSKFAHTDPHSAAFIPSPMQNPSSQIQSPHTTSQQHPQQLLHVSSAITFAQPPLYMRSGSSPPPGLTSESLPALAYGIAPPLGSGASDVDDVMIISSEEEEMSNIGEGGWKLVPKGYPPDGPRGNGNGGFISLGGKKDKDRAKEREQAREKEERERIRLMRRRTAMDRTELFAGGEEYSNGVSPILESPLDTIINGDPGVGVVRSRTLPSRRKTGDNGLDDKENAKGGPGAGSGNSNFRPTVDVNPREKDKARDKERGEKRVLKKQRRVSSSNRV